MSYKRKQGCWGARSRRGKLLIIALGVLIVVISLGLGFGLGISLRNRGGGADEVDSEPTLIQPLVAPPAALNIWQPPVNATWQIILLNKITISAGATTVEPNVDIYDIDLFLTSKETIDALHAMGKKVICYYSAGSYEPDRPDSKDFRNSDQGNGVDGWPGEKWLNLRSKTVREINEKRLKLAAEKGCDGVDPDNVDAFDNNNGLGMSAVDSVNFMRFLATKAQSLKLAIGLKNSGSIVNYVLPAMQFSVQEQCVQFMECDKFSPFIRANKPVFHIEYPTEVKPDFVPNFCKDSGPATGAYGFSTVIKKFNLDTWVEYCDGKKYNTPTG